MRSGFLVLSVASAFVAIPILGQFDDAYHGRQNTKIDFYGKVLDQDGNPIEKAEVYIDLLAGEWKTVPSMPGQPFVALRTVRIAGETGAGGAFTLRNLTGHGIEIKSITKEGYEESKQIKRSYYYSATAEPFQSDPKDPVLFVLWDQKARVNLITRNQDFDFIPDGRPYVIDLKARRIGEATNDEGDLQFQLARSKDAGKSEKFDWSFSIEGRNGIAIAPVNQDYFMMVFPPKSGFTNSYKEVHNGSEQLWRVSGMKEFYIKMDNGQGNAKMALTWDAIAAANGPKTNDAEIHISYTLNPVGLALTQ
jgi:hypothetical protein